MPDVTLSENLRHLILMFHPVDHPLCFEIVILGHAPFSDQALWNMDSFHSLLPPWLKLVAVAPLAPDLTKPALHIETQTLEVRGWPSVRIQWQGRVKFSTSLCHTESVESLLNPY